MSAPARADWKSLALLLVLALLWGGAYPLVKISVETVPPITVAAVRAAIGGLLLLAILAPRTGTDSGHKGEFVWHAFLSQGMLNLVIPWVLVAWASLTIPSTVTTILNSLSPIFIFLITWAITRHEPATPRKLVGVVLGLAGVVCIVGLDALQSLGRHTLAEIACVVGSISYAAGGIVGRRFDKVSPLVPATGATLWAAIVMVPLALVVEQPWTATPSLRSMLALLALSLFSTGAAFVIYFALLRRIGSIGTASQAYIRIVLGVGLGVFFLGEALTTNLVVGLLLVVAGVVAMTLRSSAQKP